MTRFSAAALVSLLAVFALTTNGTAQSGNASVSGSVSDVTAALIPGVTIRAANTQTGVVSAQVTNEAGVYNFTSLQPGVYRVTAELPGFQTQSYTNVVLGTSQQVRLNFTLQIAAVAQTFEVSIPVDTLLATSSSSVGTVLTENTVRDLPIVGRDALELVNIMAGFREPVDPTNSNARTGANGGFVAGISTAAVNTTRDGISVNDGRYNLGVFSATRINPDLVGELRIILAPVDAETGRGSGQVQILTRSGTNQYNGSAVWNVQNSALNANTWNNNRTNTIPSWFNRHQLSVNYGGPIVRNKTFFFALYDGQRMWSRESVRATVLTADARAGNFRFFPGVVNGNADANATGGNNPTASVVDHLGNPRTQAEIQAAVQAAGSSATVGALQTISVFNRDPNRPGFDTTGYIQRVLATMPQPNDFTGGDGLNTAVFKWNRRGDSLICSAICQQGIEDDVNRNQINAKIDHHFNERHKFNVSYTFERFTASGQRGNYPGKENEWFSQTLRKPQVLTSSLVSTLTPRIVNDFRFGLRRAWSRSPYPYDEESTKQEVLAFLPSANGYPLIFSSMPVNIANNILNPGNNTNANTSSLWTFADSLSWTRGVHAFKGGVEVRLAQTQGLNSLNGIPHVVGGAGNVAIPASAFSVTGLLAANQTAAQNLLLTLNGSVQSISQAFILNDPTWTDFRDYLEPDGYFKTRRINQNEFSWFFKDDWKIRPSLTLNLGVRYEYFGVPYEANGLTGAVVGGGLAGGFGWSGDSFENFWSPGSQRGDLTTVEFIGPRSPNPDKQIYQDDWNNFGPAVGFSWSVPWLGANKTSVRGGYSVTYQGGGRGLELDTALTSNLPGLGDAQTGFVPNGLANLATLGAFLPLPRNKPLQPVSITQQRTSNLTTWDPNYVSPYIQNFTLSVTREVRRNVTADIRYIGTRGVKLYGNIALNQANFLTNGLLDEFNRIRRGEDSAVLNQMFAGLNLGTSPTASAYLRTNTNWRGFFANGNPAGFAARLATSNELTNQGGGLVRNGGFPENFIVNNPQFNSVTFNTNPGSSTYHSMQTQVTFRPTSGLSYQATYVWSKAMAGATGGFLNPVDRRLDRALQPSHRTHDFRTNGTFELPIGPNQLLLPNSSGWLARLVERWQVSWIANINSGSPLNITGGDTYVNGGRLDVVGAFPLDIGKATMTDGLPNYFPTNPFRFVSDPQCAAVTTLNSLNQQCTIDALTDEAGNILLQHAAPGTLGNLGDRVIEGPGTFRFDLGASKTVRIDENKSIQLRVDARNVLNHPIMGNPSLNINNGTTFGQINNVSGSRQFQGQLRFTF
jgi:hypothetical protein